MIATVVSLAAVVSTMSAQRDDDDMRAASPVEARRTMQRFADCLVDRRAETPKVDLLLRTSLGNPQLGGRGRTAAIGNCMPQSFRKTRLRMQAPVMRAALFEARYRDEYGRTVPDFSSVPALTIADEFDGDVAQYEVVTRQIGDCIARREARGAHALLMSRPGSDGERAAMPAVAEAAGNCLAEGQTLRFSSVMLRGIVGEAMYKLSVAANGRKSVN